MKRMAVIMVGAPGSGKGTQGDLLEKHTGFNRYVMSDIIKKELKPGNEIYKKVIEQGKLMGDSEIFELFRKYFESDEQVIIDGIPRTLDQAYWLYGYLRRHNYSITLVNLKVDESKLLERITSRYYCPVCHRSYNKLTNKPKVEGKCDDDGEVLVQRKDDTEEVFSKRLEQFDEVKNVILDVYEGDLIEVDGDQEMDKVSQDIVKQLLVHN